MSLDMKLLVLVDEFMPVHRGSHSTEALYDALKCLACCVGIKTPS